MAVCGEIDGQEKGPWAGHRFDIVDVNDIGNGWTNVSDEVIKRIRPILGAEFRGSD
ncbi:hypothetical protein IWW55_001643 [Coemansia sp. RSA 2706]|nr:hypothetical protein IWW55_001643 [Coemansia sp. RSA 2706]